MRRASLLLLAGLILCGCGGAVDVTKTSKGFAEATNPNDIEILHTKPERKFAELGSISSSGWQPSDTAKLYNAMRAKAAPLGANAVIILETGMTPVGYGQMAMWCNGVAIRYE